MDLHPRGLLLKIRDRNLKQLGLATAALDAAIQYVYAQYEPRFKPRDLHGGVLSMDVRNQMFWYANLEPFRKDGFTVEAGLNRSVVFVDSQFTPIKMRKHPRRKRAGRSELAPVTPPGNGEAEIAQLTLLGDEQSYDPILWAPTLLWDPDPDTQTLGNAWLAALETDVDRPRVFHRVDLEVGSPALLAAGPTKADRPKVGLDFDDMFGEEGTGSDPA